MPLRKSDDVRNAQAAAVRDEIDGGTGAGYAEFRTGSQPATPADTATGTLLATVTLQDPSFTGPTAGVLTLSDPASVNGVADGTAGWARIFDGDGVAKLDGEVTATSGGGLFELSSTSITNGGAVDISGGTYTVPM